MRRVRCSSSKEAGVRRAMRVKRGQRRVGGVVITCGSHTRCEGSPHSRARAVGHGIGFRAQCSDYPYTGDGDRSGIWKRLGRSRGLVKPASVAGKKQMSEGAMWGKKRHTTTVVGTLLRGMCKHRTKTKVRQIISHLYTNNKRRVTAG